MLNNGAKRLPGFLPLRRVVRPWIADAFILPDSRVEDRPDGLGVFLGFLNLAHRVVLVRIDAQNPIFFFTLARDVQGAVGIVNFRIKV